MKKRGSNHEMSIPRWLCQPKGGKIELILDLTPPYAQIATGRAIKSTTAGPFIQRKGLRRRGAIPTNPALTRPQRELI